MRASPISIASCTSFTRTSSCRPSIPTAPPRARSGACRSRSGSRTSAARPTVAHQANPKVARARARRRIRRAGQRPLRLGRRAGLSDRRDRLHARPLARRRRHARRAHAHRRQLAQQLSRAQGALGARGGRASDGARRGESGARDLGNDRVGHEPARGEGRDRASRRATTERRSACARRAVACARPPRRSHARYACFPENAAPSIGATHAAPCRESPTARARSPRNTDSRAPASRPRSPRECAHRARRSRAARGRRSTRR